MDLKSHLLLALREHLDLWESFLATLSDEEITRPRYDFAWSIKDVVAHLWAWQQISTARIEAARLNREPRFPSWVAEIPGDWEENADQTNAQIYHTYHALPWTDIHQNWHDNYLHLLDSAAAIPERDLLDAGRYPWLNGYSLISVLIATYDHHLEHLERMKEASRKDAKSQS